MLSRLAVALYLVAISARADGRHRVLRRRRGQIRGICEMTRKAMVAFLAALVLQGCATALEEPHTSVDGFCEISPC